MVLIWALGPYFAHPLVKRPCFFFVCHVFCASLFAKRTATRKSILALIGPQPQLAAVVPTTHRVAALRPETRRVAAKLGEIVLGRAELLLRFRFTI